jgi:hippurate hydrolase
MADYETMSDLHKEMTGWRRHLHQNPEFGFEEVQTAAFVAEKLRSFGIEEVAEGVGGTGVVATLRAGEGNRAISFRADMDALRIEEAGESSYRSQTPGVMHACGHDGHTTMLLGAAKTLAETRDFNGVVHLIFQPAEEWGKGMIAMLDDGLLDRFPHEEAYGLHNWPGLPVGHFETRTGGFMGAEDNFEIRVQGVGGHASRPHEINDAIVAGSAIVLNLQTIVSRQVDPSQLAVVSVTEFLSDGTRNAIAGGVRILGDCRSFDPAVSKRIEEVMRRVALGVGAAHGCSIEVDYSREFVPVVNDAALTGHAVQAAQMVAAPGNVNSEAAKIGGSEDFARLLAHVPGNFIMMGNGDSAALHNSSYDFNDDVLPLGVEYFATLARQRLPVDQK